MRLGSVHKSCNLSKRTFQTCTSIDPHATGVAQAWPADSWSISKKSTWNLGIESGELGGSSGAKEGEELLEGGAGGAGGEEGEERVERERREGEVGAGWTDEGDEVSW